MKKSILTAIAIFLIAFIFFGFVYAQGQIQIGKIVTDIFIDEKTQDIYIVKTVNGELTETKRVPVIQRMMYQSQIENYKMFEEIEKNKDE